MLLTVFAPTNTSAVGTYGTRVDFTWNESSTAVEGFQIQYKVDGTSTWSSTLSINPVDPDVSLLPSGDESFGEVTTDALNTSGGSIRSAAMGGLTDNTTYDFQIQAVGTDTTTSSWASFSVTTPGTDSPEAGIASDIADQKIYTVMSYDQIPDPSPPGSPTSGPAYEPPGIEIHSTTTDYQNVWIKRVDDSTGAVVMLPVDHADFIDQYDTDQQGSITITDPAYLDTAAKTGLDLSHAYTYYIAVQTGVPTISSEWQKIDPLLSYVGNTNDDSYFPYVNETNFAAYETTQGVSPAIHLSWQPDPGIYDSTGYPTNYNFIESNGYILQWSTDADFEPDDTHNITVSGSVEVAGSLPATMDDYTFTSLDAGESLSGNTYYFRVEPVAGVHASGGADNTIYDTAYSDPWDATQTVTVGSVTVPTGTPSLSATSATSTSVELTWSLSGVNWEGTPSDDQYVYVEMADDSNGFVVERKDSVNDGNTDTITGLTPGTNYTFRIRAANSTDPDMDSDTGESAPSSVILIGTTPSNISGANYSYYDGSAISDISTFATAYGPNLVQLLWDKSSDPDIQYVVERKLASSDSWPTVNPGDTVSDSNPDLQFVPASQLSFNGVDTSNTNVYFYNDTNVTEDTAYDYKIGAITVNGSTITAVGNFSGGGDDTYGAVTTYPAAPTNLTMGAPTTSGGITQIKLNWDNNSPNADKVRVEYTKTTTAISDAVYGSTSDGSHHFDVTGTSFYTITPWGGTVPLGTDPMTFYFDISADPDATYTFRIAMVDSSDNEFSAYSNVVSTVAPPAPTYVAAQPISPTAIEAFWGGYDGSGKPSDLDDQISEGWTILNDNGSLLAWYNSDDQLVSSETVPAGVSETIVSGLDPNQSYKFVVWSYNINDLATDVGTVPAMSGLTAPTGISQGRYSSGAESL